MQLRFIFTIYVSVFILTIAKAEDGYDLWLRYQPVQGALARQQVAQLFTSIHLPGTSATHKVIEAELQRAARGFLQQRNVPQLVFTPAAASLVIAEAQHPWVKASVQKTADLGTEGFAIVRKSGGPCIVTANTAQGLLYGTFHLLRLIDQGKLTASMSLTSIPRLQLRMLNHWDNLTRTVERGYAGGSIWNWHTLPDYIDQRYVDYARANASIGINATVLTNVNANATVLTPAYLQKVKALADIMRPFGIKIFLTARFSAPIEIGKLPTADPEDKAVQAWWVQKTNEIYALIPDFGGFLVKANSEGQPGPQDYGRTHAQGANLLASALQPHKGIVIWRAFVYSSDTPEDRFKQAYTDFVPLDGQFMANVMVQVKNGPIDFQPREPFHPLFGAMPRTPQVMEFQLTQEYLGFATHLVYLAPMFKEVLDARTYRPSENTTVANIIDGSAFGHSLSGMAGVSNIGSDLNWTGHPFAQANWYALGRLAWDHSLSAAQIAHEWTMQTFTRNVAAVNTIVHMMQHSHEAAVNYMTPLGLHHIMGYGHHYGPAPWYSKAPRDDWNCTYFHRANEKTIGFDRTASGSNALAQYAAPIRDRWANLETTDPKWLTWFHAVPWQHTLSNGRSFWDALCMAYQEGVDTVAAMQKKWALLHNHVDAQRFNQVTQLLRIQHQEAIWWRDACIAYFGSISKLPVPKGVPPPPMPLSYYQSLHFPYAPGNTH